MRNFVQSPNLGGNLSWYGELRTFLFLKTARRSYVRASKTKLRADCNAYKADFNKYNSELKKAKCRSWNSFCESIEGVDNVARFRKMLSKDPMTKAEKAK